MDFNLVYPVLINLFSFLKNLQKLSLEKQRKHFSKCKTTLLLSKKTRCSVNLDTPVLKVRDKWRSLSCYQQSLTILAQIHLICLPTVKKNCAELYKSGKTTSGVYTIDPDGLGAFKSSVTKRQPVGDGQCFRGDWMARLTSIAAGPIKNGFGNLYGEFWLGLDKIHRLTTTIKNKLRVDLMDTKSKTAYAEYNFAVSSEKNKYKLSVGTYSGNLSDNKEICCC